MSGDDLAGNISMLLFDMDGLLLDTERIYTEATQKILDPFGKEFTYDVKLKMMGRKQADAARFLVSHYGIEAQLSPDEFTARLTRHLEDLLRDCALLPGVEQLLLHCRANDIPMAVATSSSGDRFKLKTANHQDLFSKVFDVIVTGDDVTESKPHPEIFQKAARLVDEKRGLKTEPENILVFEDAVLGVQSGLRAGMKVVMVNDMLEGPPVEPGSQPHQFLKTMEDFDPAKWGLPDYKGQETS